MEPDFSDDVSGRASERPRRGLADRALIIGTAACGIIAAAILLFAATRLGADTTPPRPAPRPPIAAGTDAATPPAAKAQDRAPAAPVRVIDGDTIEVGGETIRLADIDTPERGARARCDAEARLAELATTRLRILLAEQAWRIERERKRDGTPSRDRYERTLAIVTLTHGDAACRVSGTNKLCGGSVGMVLVAEGYAVAWEGRRHDWCGSAAR